MSKYLAISALIFLSGLKTYGQATILKNSVDSSVTIKTVTISPFKDNVDQIYAKPLTQQMNIILQEDKVWDVRSFPDTVKFSPEQFEDQPTNVTAALKKASTDALITARVTKGPRGITIRLNLFSGAQGLLLSQEILQDYQGFEIADLRTQLANMYAKLKAKMPYTGLLLSRKGQLVTIGVGRNQNIKEGSDLSVIQIIKLNRHPKFQFLISAEKEIIGRVHVDKVEDSLTFGTITLERSEGVIQAGMKFLAPEFVQYPAASSAGDGKLNSDLSARADSPLALGQSPKEWVPESAPSFGKAGILLGLGTYTVSNNLSTAGGVSGTSAITPSIHLDGELWLTTNWIAGVDLRQFVAQVPNGLSGSSPGNINVSTMQTTLQFGYNFLIADQFFGPKIQILGGYSKLSASVDDSSPTAYTSTSFSGMAFGLGGSFPVSEETPLTLGAKMLYFLSPTVSETPVTSGASSSAQITTFSGYGVYRWTEHMNLRGELVYDMFSASFTGSGTRSQRASSSSHAMTTFAGGIEYLF